MVSGACTHLAAAPVVKNPAGRIQRSHECFIASCDACDHDYFLGLLLLALAVKTTSVSRLYPRVRKATQSRLDGNQVSAENEIDRLCELKDRVKARLRAISRVPLLDGAAIIAFERSNWCRGPLQGLEQCIHSRERLLARSQHCLYA
jgi:hypothetical protein